jgi:hypothetical protein
MCYYILPKNNNNCVINISLNKKEPEICLSYSTFEYFNKSRTQLSNFFLKNNNITFEYISHIINTYNCIFSNIKNSNINISKFEYKSSSFYDFIEIINLFNIFDNKIKKTGDPVKMKKTRALIISSTFTYDTKCLEYFNNTYNNLFLTFNYNYDAQIEKYLFYTSNETQYKYDVIFFELNETDYLDINKYILGLILSLLAIIKEQKEHGTLILKISNINHKPILDILYILTTLYDNVSIIKPVTSNILTNEKYVICRNFIVNNKNNYNHYYNNLKYTYYLLCGKYVKNQNLFIDSIIQDENISYFFKTKVNNINILIIQQQIEIINHTFNLINNKNNCEKIKEIIHSNIQKSIQFCKKYNLPHHNFMDENKVI